MTEGYKVCSKIRKCKEKIDLCLVHPFLLHGATKLSVGRCVLKETDYMQNRVLVASPSG